MLNLQYQNSKVIICVREDTLPYICGFVKNKDIFFAIDITIYRNSRGKKGNLIARYTHMWEEAIEEDDIYTFISNILSDVNFRRNYTASIFNWEGTFETCFENVDERPKIFGDVKQKKEPKTSTLVKNKNNQFKINNNESTKNISLKLEAISSCISDRDIEIIKETFSDRPSIIFAMRLVIIGEPLKNAIETTKRQLAIV